jgi:hypothetical protein
VERVRVAPPLDQLLAAGQGQHHPPGLDEVLLLPRALGAGEVPVGPLGVHPGLRPQHPGAGQRRGQRVLHDPLAVGGGHGERVDQRLGLVPARLGRPGRQHDPLAGPGRRRPGVAQGQVGGHDGVAGLA